MAKCYRCQIDLTSSNSADEHIIINACGGRLKSMNLLCRECNSLFGNSCDKELASVTNYLSTLLSINRQRGIPQPIKGKSVKSGEDYYLDHKGSPKKVKPTIIEKKEGDNINLTIQANDEKQFKSILKSLKKKYPQIDIENVLKSAERKTLYLNDKIHFKTKIGGKEVFKAITKIAINYFIFVGGDRKYIKHLLPYLSNETDLDVVWFHYPNIAPYKTDVEEVSHIIRIIGNAKEKILYAYIELFNVHNFIVKLSANYIGKDIQSDYVYDILKLQELSKLIDLVYTRFQLLDIFDNKDDKPFEKVQYRFNRVLDIADKRQVIFHQRELISKAVQDSLGKKPEGEVITKEMFREVADEVMKKLIPFIAHRLNSGE